MQEMLEFVYTWWWTWNPYIMIEHMYYECTMTSWPSWIIFKRIRCFSSSTYSVNQWLYNKQDFVRTGWNNLKPCLLEYNHLTNQQLWLNCVSVMCGFLGSSQEFCFSFLPLMLAARRHVTTLGSNFKTWHRHKSHAATDYMRSWQAV